MYSKKVAAKLSKAATAATGWAARDGVAFHLGKTEVAIFLKKRTTSKVTVEVGESKDPFNKEATRWLGVWLDSRLTLKEHHAVRMKSGRKAMMQLRKLAAQMGLGPANCRKASGKIFRVRTQALRSDAPYASETSRRTARNLARWSHSGRRVSPHMPLQTRTARVYAY